MTKDPVMRFEIVNVDPVKAAAWLATPWVRQRNPSPAVVRKYARAMSEGRWEEPSLDPIGFTPDGHLGNGQHRLQAVIDSGWTGDMLIAYDVPEENFLVVDTGRKRTAGQFVRLPNASLVTAIARTVLWYDRLHPLPLNGTSATAFDNDEVLGFVDAHADLLTECSRDSDFAYRNGGIPPSGHGAVLFIARRSNEVAEEIISTWLDGVSTGIGLGPTDPRLRLREYFIRHPKRDRGTAWSATVRAFNAYIENRPLAKMVTFGRTGDNVPVVRYAGRAQKKPNPMHRTPAQREAAAENIKSAALKRRRRPEMLKGALDG